VKVARERVARGVVRAVYGTTAKGRRRFQELLHQLAPVLSTGGRHLLRHLDQQRRFDWRIRRNAC